MKYLLFYVLLILTYSVQAQTQTTYTVLRVEPKDAAKVNGKVIKIGEKLKADAQITLMNNSNAYLRVFDGRESATIKKSGKLATVLEAARRIADADLAGSKTVIANKDELIKLLQTKPLLIIDSMQIRIPSSMYALPVFKGKPESKFFFITYPYQGEEIDKLLSNLPKNTFVLDEKVLSIDGKKINTSQITNMELRYAIDAKTDEKVAQNLAFVFLKTADLKEEIKQLIAASQEMDKDKLFMEVLRYLYQHYGKPEREHLKNWLKRNFEGRF